VTIQTEITGLIATLARLGSPLQTLLPLFAAGLFAVAVVPALRRWLPLALGGVTAVLLAGEVLLTWFHWRLYEAAIVVNPATGVATGRVAVPLWVESEKLYVWALVVALLGVMLRRHREELMPGAAIATALLMVGAAFWGKPFTEPLPQFLGQYGGYLQAMASGVPQAAESAFRGMEGSRQFYYNTWYMWVHPPLLFVSYGAFALSFVATLQMIRTRYSAYETTAYRWARFGYLPLTAGMLIGFPWAILAWQGESWWWSGKVNMSIMMWLLYTGVLHARLYLRRRGMWKWVAALSILSFVILVLTYLSTYIVPGAHSYVLGTALLTGGAA
jgi:cytochrome c biogenesis factor